MKSIILKISEYKEKDAIVTAMNETGVFTFSVKGLNNPKGRFICLNNPLTIAELTFSENKKYKHLVLKEADIIYSPLNLMGNLKELALVMLLSNLINQMLQDEEKLVVFQYILSSLEDIYNNKRVNENVLFLIFKFLNVSGYSFEVSGCTLCGSKNNIVTFSFDDGGFICKKCLNHNKVIVSGNDLLKLRSIIKSTKNKFEFDKLDDKTFDSILKEAILFIEDNFGIKIKNKEIIM